MNLLNQLQLPSPVQKFEFPDGVGADLNFFIKRDDLIHPHISGNKWRKLKLNLLNAQAKKLDTVLTFGGAFSNHLAATSFACKSLGLKSIGVVRGEEVDLNNSTMKFVRECGMQVFPISREDYKLKTDEGFIQGLHEQFGAFYLVPEGGSNFYGVTGCQEIVTENPKDFEKIDLVCCSAGTATTISGILAADLFNFKTLCFSPFKGGVFLKQEIEKQLLFGYWDNEWVEEKLNSVEFILDYHFGGFGKIKPELIKFIDWIYTETGIQFDLLYNGKMLFAIYDLCKRGFFKSGQNIMIIHTGGVQGNAGFSNVKL